MLLKWLRYQHIFQLTTNHPTDSQFRQTPHSSGLAWAWLASPRQRVESEIGSSKTKKRSGFGRGEQKRIFFVLVDFGRFWWDIGEVTQNLGTPLWYYHNWVTSSKRKARAGRFRPDTFPASDCCHGRDFFGSRLRSTAKQQGENHAVVNSAGQVYSQIQKAPFVFGIYDLPDLACISFSRWVGQKEFRTNQSCAIDSQSQRFLRRLAYESMNGDFFGHKLSVTSASFMFLQVAEMEGSSEERRGQAVQEARQKAVELGKIP